MARRPAFARGCNAPAAGAARQTWEKRGAAHPQASRSRRDGCQGLRSRKASTGCIRDMPFRYGCASRSLRCGQAAAHPRAGPSTGLAPWPPHSALGSPEQAANAVDDHKTIPCTQAAKRVRHVSRRRSGAYSARLWSACRLASRSTLVSRAACRASMIASSCRDRPGLVGESARLAGAAAGYLPIDSRRAQRTDTVAQAAIVVQQRRSLVPTRCGRPRRDTACLKRQTFAYLANSVKLLPPRSLDRHSVHCLRSRPPCTPSCRFPRTNGSLPSRSLWRPPSAPMPLVRKTPIPATRHPYALRRAFGLPTSAPRSWALTTNTCSASRATMSTTGLVMAQSIPTVPRRVGRTGIHSLRAA